MLCAKVLCVGKQGQALSEEEKKVYALVSQRFLKIAQAMNIETILVLEMCIYKSNESAGDDAGFKELSSNFGELEIEG